MLYPFTFHPLFKERVWGGRKLQELYQKELPNGEPIGESWEISDRPGDVSVIANGPLAGKDLSWLMQNHQRELLGSTRSQGGRFPLLVKILDARDKLSLQVHPPAAKAAALKGEPKTEMWFLTDTGPGAELYVGLRHGATREQFEQKVRDGSVADCFHRVPVHPGDVMFLPSGRVHAIGAGMVIFEIQQNSDTTYRVFDWNRVGLDGKPRQLHVAESMDSIDFNDFEPGLVKADPRKRGVFTTRLLIDDQLFEVESVQAAAAGKMVNDEPNAKIVGVVEGRVTASGGGQSVTLNKGQFCLLPSAPSSELSFEAGASALLVRA